MSNFKPIIRTGVTGVQPIDLPPVYSRIQVAVEQTAGAAGQTLAVTMIPPGLTAAQAIEGDDISFDTPMPQELTAAIDKIVLTPSGDATYNISIIVA